MQTKNRSNSSFENRALSIEINFVQIFFKMIKGSGKLISHILDETSSENLSGNIKYKRYLSHRLVELSAAKQGNSEDGTLTYKWPACWGNQV